MSDCGRKIRNDVHTDTLLQTRTRIMTINQHKSILHAFSVPNWWELCGVVDVLTVLLLSPIRLISIYAAGEIDNRYGFLSIGSTKNHVATLTCFEWLLKYVNVSIILAPKLTLHACALLIDNVGNYLYLNNGSFKFGVDPHQINLRLHHFSQFQHKKKFQKLAGLWLAGEMVNPIGIYGSKVADGLSAFQRRSCIENVRIDPAGKGTLLSVFG